MPSEVFYRKWRPRTLANVVGQEPVTRTLKNALSTGRIAHAYLFCGPRGTGKTSTGRILAKAVNCLNNQEGEPCNSCSICQMVNEGRCIDLVEIDGASNRGIDEIRDLREKINFAPSSCKYKVYIIDEVHMLTEPAFNALLKTLEEPPPHAIFVLATTESHKIPLTISSRCQRFDFRRLTQRAIAGKLQAICDSEGIKAETQAFALIGRAATGSLRDAENLLEQLVLSQGRDLTVDKVVEELGLSHDARVGQLAHHIIEKEIGPGLTLINSVSDDGIDLRRFSFALVDYLRALLMVKSDVPECVDYPPEIISEMKKLVSGSSINDLTKAVRLFAQVDFRMDPHSTLALELALIDYSVPAEGHSTGTQDVADLPESTPVEYSASESARDKEPASPTHDEEAGPEGASQTAAPSLSGPCRTIEEIRERWGQFIESCRGVGSSGNLDALLRSSCEPVELQGDTLTLGFYWEFQRSKIEDAKYRHLVEKKLEEIFGVPYHVRCVLRPRESRKQTRTVNPVVSEALKLGARIIEEGQ